jgi:hypothetical protein
MKQGNGCLETATPQRLGMLESKSGGALRLPPPSKRPQTQLYGLKHFFPMAEGIAYAWSSIVDAPKR